MKHTAIYGMMAEFDSPTDLVVAARKTYAAGYKKIDAYSPFPIEELSEAIGFHHNGVAAVVLVGGILGHLIGRLVVRNHRRRYRLTPVAGLDHGAPSFAVSLARQ
jgi:prolipoprotein diacylglyceryltransferase